MQTMGTLLALLLLGCGAGSDDGDVTDGDADADADADGDADTDGDSDGDADPPTLEERLAGFWELESTECGGEAPLEPYDGARVSVDFAQGTATLSLTRVHCDLRIVFGLVLDDAASSLAGAMTDLSCFPDGCCGIEEGTVIPDWTGSVAFDEEERFRLTTSDAESLAAGACSGTESPVPVVQTFRREPLVPPEPDDTVCGIDAFAGGRSVYYVAIGEPGADNDACDGRAPTDEGAGHCPFRDFSSARVRRLLFEDEQGQPFTRSVTIAVRAGTYPIEPLDLFAPEPPVALQILSDARRAEEAVILLAYQDEPVVLDGSCAPELPTCDAPEDPGRIWTILSVDGRFVRIEGLEYEDAHKHNVNIGSSDTCVLGNTFNGSYGSDSDSMKGHEGAGPNVIVRGNEFRFGYEQAIDATSTIGWLIEDNDFHDGADRGVGFKFAARDDIVRGNRFWNLPGMAVSLGGVSSDHVFPEEAVRIVAEGNVVTNGGGLANVFSCRSCAIRDNATDGARLGVLVDPSEPSGCPGTCASSSDLTMTGNRFRDLEGDPVDGGEGAPPNTFVGLLDDGATGFTAGENLYCALAGWPEVFAVGGELVDFAAWQERTGTDETSRVVAADAAECAGDF